MEDKQIVDLYLVRSEFAIQETRMKYGGYCYRIAYGILTNHEDSEETVNDTCLAAWNAIPPSRPLKLSAFLGKITRKLSIDRWRGASAQKRGGGEFPLCLEELKECVSGESSVEQRQMDREVVAALNRMVSRLPKQERLVFLRRYWYMDSIERISKTLGCSQTRVTTMLCRTRKKLRDELEKEGLL